VLLKDWQQLFYSELHERNKRRTKDFISEKLHQNINASEDFSKDIRMRVYSYAFWARQVDSLLEDFPTLEKILGKKAFKDILRDYIAAHPSTTYTLAELGRELPVFLKSESMPEWLVELATFEWNLFEIGYYPLQPAPTLEDIEVGSFTLKETVRVFRFNYPMIDIYQDEIEKASQPEAVVIVKNEHTEYFQLSLPAALILESLLVDESLDTAIGAAGDISPEKVQEYFQEFMANGLFTSQILATP